ncbi:hypothetical protein OPKNFCMD_3269 [Methylobacterium crusticola]|uniref:Uncharacterized protein n=1 Tax=Methylobacterium crusticola TaxID=1697972 RepID=A0ABQ4R0Z8_9HYPH|nr:hypothetical protein [Methylobacterium crusticola]GJD50526.1 hypothetical protein OPKNFCMD_3269 [Methylobacterium crusticola]
MHMRAGERLRLTMSGAGCRAVVSLNTYALTQPAIEGLDPCEDGFGYDVTPWLHPGRNVLSVVLIGPSGEQPFRLVAERAGQALLLLDETEFLPLSTPWRLWTTTIALAASLPLPRSVMERGFERRSLSRGPDLHSSMIA